jgi:hypothetical protein
MSEDDAALYVGVSPARFRIERDRGMWPQPVDRACRRNTYDRAALDRAVDRLAGYQDPQEIEDDLIRRAAWAGSK